MSIQVSTARSVPKARPSLSVGYPVGTSGTVPKALGLNRAALTEGGFEGKVGQSLVIPNANGAAIAVGIGDPANVTVDTLRTAASCLVRAASKRTELATTLADLAGVDAAAAGAALTEAVQLASYRFDRFRSEPKPSVLQSVTLVVGASRDAAVQRGIARGEALAAATTMARDLANTPPGHLTARMLADIAVNVAAQNDLIVDVYNRDQLEAMGCGGIVGVNAGSKEPPRMVRLCYAPKNATGHLAMVGKGVMYDSGGLSLKPSDGMHVIMKMDMSGAAAVLA
ncbi:MAG TPA: M17 family peptidase N-terminal domain-containing protein, partial [Ilumatobacteraceae bacterium]|nr:M17 family peptidase N-terminal domain-containing protein [Ilumatobacteraceae bacterium]